MILNLYLRNNDFMILNDIKLNRIMLGCKKLWDIIPRCIIPPFLPWLCVSLRLAKVKGGKFPSPMSDTKRHRDQYQSYTWFRKLLNCRIIFLRFIIFISDKSILFFSRSYRDYQVYYYHPVTDLFDILYIMQRI